MSQNFVPEMHDLGKLAISAISGPHHDFAPIRQRPDLPDNATWRGIV